MHFWTKTGTSEEKQKHAKEEKDSNRSHVWQKFLHCKSAFLRFFEGFEKTRKNRKTTPSW